MSSSASTRPRPSVLLRPGPIGRPGALVRRFRCASRAHFRVGGRERSQGIAPDGRAYSYNALFQDIVPAERIVYTYDMVLEETRISVSLATVEFTLEVDGYTRLVFTEQAAFLDGHESPARRARGHGRPPRRPRGGASERDPRRLSGTPGRGHRSHRLRGTSEQRDARPSQSAPFPWMRVRVLRA